MIRSLLCAAVLIPAVFASVAATAGDSEAPQLPLSYANVNFNNPAEVNRLYDQVKFTAREVCDSGAPVSAVNARAGERRCQASAVANAVRDIDRSQLTQLASVDQRDASARAMAVTMDRRA